MRESSVGLVVLLEMQVLMGDWNATFSGDDYEGPRRHVNKGCVDIGFIGPKFTWQHGMTLERLDKAIFNMNWNDTFSTTWVKHLYRLKSDHRPLLVNLEFSMNAKVWNSKVFENIEKRLVGWIKGI
ncbi:hypothetical protein GOBAR_AA10154 [Gossypium barbadense]|uniref:Endonuclease/exonuclease/phosphatase domain-containing protein n=1 Tax=Gossypium barbadense TaxID=3634 RepID=A0A2P5Y4G1_GOSBA|nr:hypothetical protein GOBAR_AA10154 [Gossypium barbadense]